MAPAQFQDALYTLGSTIESRCDDDSTQVFIRGIEENLEPTLALLDAWFSSPKIEPAILKQFIASKIERRKSDLEAENMLTFGLGEFANFGERSVLLTRPSNADLRRLTPSRVRKDVRSLFDLEHRTLYSGTRSADEVAAMVAQGRKHAKTGPLPLRRYRPVPETKIYFLHRKQAKADVRITLPSAPRDPGETPRHEVLARYIGGGTGSITFREIRTKRSLAYSVSAWVDTGRPGDDLEYAGRMQNQPDKVAEAVPALLDTLRRAVVEPGRFAEARAAIDEAYRGSRVNPRSAAFVVDDWRDQGYSSDPRPGWHAAVQGLTEDSIAALLADLGGRPAIITIVGDEASIDLDALAELGELERIRPERLFRL
jgi:predicted Zn-dependent peptidase